jgi:outer membrane lipoprotein SlyB
MKKLTVIAVVAAIAMTGCANLDSQYAYVVDNEQVTKAENLKRQQRNVAHVVWVNPPMVKQQLAQQQQQ